MSNARRLFTADLKRMGCNVVTVIIVLGLVVLPSVFSWYNTIACWNVFDNTGNLTVAVANSDEGYQSDLVPLRVNIGEQVISALRANDQMNWEFTDEEDAIDGAESGHYYAAVVIPEDFSRDMMTFYADDSQHAEITYYANEKKNAIAPKVTGQGADQMSAQVNRVFAQTLSETALGISSSLANYLDSADAGGAIAKLAERVESAGDRMGESASMLHAYASVMSAAKSLVDDSGNLVAQARSAAGDVSGRANEAESAVSDMSGTLEDASGAVLTALEQSSEGYGEVAEAVDAAFDSTSRLASDSVTGLRAQADAVDSHAGKYRDFANRLEEMKGSLPQDVQPAVDVVVDRVNASVLLQERLRDSLDSAADSIEDGNSGTQAQHDEAKQLAVQAQSSLDGAKEDYETGLKPTLEKIASDARGADASLSQISSNLDAAAGSLAGTSGSVAEKIGTTQKDLESIAGRLEQSSAKLNDLSERISTALDSGDSDVLREAIGSDPVTLAKALSAPVGVDRHAVYPVENFGSAMSPLYTALALWIGSLLIMIAIKVNPSQRSLAVLDDPSPRQLFLGRFGVVAVVSLMQSTCLGLGNLFFLRVQADSPVLYMLCLWISGLVFAFIVYTLVASFANLGKALSVFLLIVQVSAGGGSYPLQLLPQFAQAASPYLPVTHAVNAMRAAMFGLYNGDFWTQMGALLLIAVPFVLLGLVVRNPLIRLVGAFVEKVESTKVM